MLLQEEEVIFDRESNLARSYKFENCCCSSWGHFAQAPIYFMNSQNIGMIHKILEKFPNIGTIHKILERFTKYWKNSQNIGNIHKTS